MSSILARIHQGRYDTEEELLRLRDNAIRLNKTKELDAINMRLKKVSPKIYKRLVGPLFDRVRDNKFKCYCNNPKSLYEIYKDIMNNTVPYDALSCDACWQEDLSATWGYYGYVSKAIPKDVWKKLCNSRSYDKFVE